MQEVVDVWACWVLLAAVWVVVEWFCIADCLSFAFGLWSFVFGRWPSDFGVPWSDFVYNDYLPYK